jgi:competence protein ComEC
MSRIVRIVYGVTVCVFLASVFIALALYQSGSIPRPELRVHFLDIGQGDAILIETPENTSILVDAGSDGHVVQQLGEVLPWWQRKIDYMLITHPDHDHYGGFQSVLQKYTVGEVLWTGDEDPSRAFQSLVQDIRKRSIPMRKVIPGDVLHWPSGVTLRILWPPDSYQSKDKNNRSLTALLSYGDEDYLLTGDLPQAEESQMMVMYPSVTAEVLKVGHHGSRTSSGTDFLVKLHPRYCIISAGKANSYGHPHAEVLTRLAEAHCEIHSTMVESRISTVTDGKSIPIGKERFLLWESFRYGILGMFTSLSF